MIQVRRYSHEYIYARPEVVKRLRFLTNGGWGRHPVGSALSYDLSYQRPGVFVLAWEKGEIIGWAFVCQRFTPRGHKKAAQVGCYVARPHRGKGVGSKLLQKVIKIPRDVLDMEILACPWNKAGLALYDKWNFRIAHDGWS